MTNAQKKRFNYYFDIAEDNEWEKIFELEDDPKRYQHYLDIKGLALDRIKTLKKFVPVQLKEAQRLAEMLIVNPAKLLSD